MANETTDHLIQWLDNDYGTYMVIQEAKEEFEGDPTDYRDCKEFGEKIRFDVINPGDGLLGHMLGLVEWDQVGKHFLED